RCSAWAGKKFGHDLAVALVERVPAAVKVAVDRQVRTQDASGLDHNYPFGAAWEAPFDELAFHCGDLPGVAIARLPGKAQKFTIANGKVLVPFRYSGDRVTLLTDPKVAKSLNKTARILLAERGSKPRHEQLDILSHVLGDEIANAEGLQL